MLDNQFPSHSRNECVVPSSLISLIERSINSSIPNLHKALDSKNPSNFRLALPQKIKLSTHHFKPISGLSGTNWLIEIGKIKWIARSINPQKSQLGINRALEHKILNLVKNQNIAPKNVTLSREWLVVEWIPSDYPITQEGDIRIESIVKLMKHIKQNSLSKQTISLQERYEFLFANIDKKRITANWVKNHSLFLQSKQPSRSPMILAHMDVHIGNLVMHNHNLKLIDWEYAGDIEEHISLASLFGSMNWTSTQSIEFISQYFNHHHTSDKEQYYLDTYNLISKWFPWFDYLQFLWYEIRWQQTQEAHFLELSEVLRAKFS